MRQEVDASTSEAQSLLQQARKAEENGDDELALKLVNQALGLFDTEEGRVLKRHIEKYGHGSEAAQAVARILTPRTSYYQIMQLPRDATIDQIKKAFKQLSLLVHPDRNHARRAEEAFKALNQAFSVLGETATRRVYE